MSRDILYLLKHDFRDGPGATFYCPECTQITGVLALYPQLRHALDVRYGDFPRPRAEIVELVGEANQSCPVLVIADGTRRRLKNVKVEAFGDRRFVSGAEEIGNYFSQVHGVGRPH